MEIDRYCIQWEEEHTHLFVSPEINNARLVIVRLQTGNVFRNLYKTLNQKNPIGSVTNILNKQQAAEADMNTLLRMNTCNSHGLMRFHGFGGRSTGTVRITFNNNGFPDCLYFIDFQTTCRTADRRIVTEYANRSYEK